MDNDEELDSNIRVIHSISSTAAVAMLNHVLGNFQYEFLSGEILRGSFVVLGADGRTLVDTPMGSWLPRHQEIARKKARTAWNLTDDTKAVASMNANTRSGYGDLIETTFEGGVALFGNSSCTDFIGVGAFSGCPRGYGDARIVAKAARERGIYTKVVLPD